MKCNKSNQEIEIKDLKPDFINDLLEKCNKCAESDKCDLHQKLEDRKNEKIKNLSKRDLPELSEIQTTNDVYDL